MTAIPAGDLWQYRFHHLLVDGKFYTLFSFLFGAGFALAWPHASRWLGVFVAPGRMALTNYLTHSVLGVLLFYGIGLGGVGRLPLLPIYGYAVVLYALQTLFSHWWLARHAQGPMEALWRRWTYPRSAGLLSF